MRHGVQIKDNESKIFHVLCRDELNQEIQMCTQLGSIILLSLFVNKTIRLLRGAGRIVIRLLYDTYASDDSTVVKNLKRHVQESSKPQTR